METSIEIHSWSKQRGQTMGGWTLLDISTTPTLLKLRTLRTWACGIFQKSGDQDGSWENVSFIYDRGTIPTKSQRYCCLTKTSTITALVDMPTWIGRISQRPTPGCRTMGNKWLLREEECLLHGWTTCKLLSNFIWPHNTHMNYAVWDQQAEYMCV